jgi:nucleotide-binding universal stress UspA family protein
MVQGSRGKGDPDSIGASGLDDAEDRIVVGIDGTKGSAAALRWALEEAQLRGAAVHAVMAWHQPAAVVASSDLTSLGVDPSIGAQFVLAAAVEAEVERLRAKSGEGCDVVITCEALEGDPGVTLVRAAESAGLLVVGTRGHGGFVGAMLGSVSHHVVAHATCPVVVVTNPARARGRQVAGRSAGQDRARSPLW